MKVHDMVEILREKHVLLQHSLGHPGRGAQDSHGYVHKPYADPDVDAIP